MPDPKDNPQTSADTRQPDPTMTTDNAAAAGGERATPPGAGNGTGTGGIKDNEAPTSNSYGHTRDSGERLK